jgi:hypothetical protein
MKKIVTALAVTAAIAMAGCIKVSTTPPTDLPQYVKIMPGGQQVMTMDMGALKAEVFQVTGTTDDVLAFYRAQAQADGLPEQPNQSTSNSDPTQKQVTFADANAARMLVVVTKPQSGETLVTLTYRPTTGGGAAPAAPTNAAGS